MLVKKKIKKLQVLAVPGGIKTFSSFDMEKKNANILFFIPCFSFHLNVIKQKFDKQVRTRYGKWARV